MNRRSFVVTLGLAALSEPVAAVGAGPSIAAGTDRHLLREFNLAFADLSSDRHLLLVQADGADDQSLAEHLRTAFGDASNRISSLTARKLRDIYLKRKDHDLRALKLVELDGHFLAASEYSLGKILRIIDPA